MDKLDAATNGRESGPADDPTSRWTDRRPLGCQTRRTLLEPDAVKVARPVLRRARRREAPGLSDPCNRLMPRFCEAKAVVRRGAYRRSLSPNRNSARARVLTTAYRSRAGAAPNDCKGDEGAVRLGIRQASGVAATSTDHIPDRRRCLGARIVAIASRLVADTHRGGRRRERNAASRPALRSMSGGEPGTDARRRSSAPNRGGVALTSQPQDGLSDVALIRQCERLCIQSERSCERGPSRETRSASW